MSRGMGSVWGGIPPSSFLTPGVLPPGWSLTRASKATHFDSSGSLVEDAPDVPRWTYDPSTLALQGFLNEPLRPNVTRNPRLEGLLSGTPGTPPTFMAGGGTINGLARTISSGTANGFNYMDLRYVGTTVASASGSGLFNLETTTQTPASIGQLWAGSAYAYLISVTGVVTVQLALVEADASGAAIASTPINLTTGGTLSGKRQSVNRQFNNASTACTYMRLQYTVSAGVVLDFTVRIGDPQQEQGTGASSIILPPVGAPAAQTRSVDVLTRSSLPNGTYNIDIYRLSGLTTVTGVVVSDGTYTAPTDVSPLRTIIFRRTA